MKKLLILTSVLFGGSSWLWAQPNITAAEYFFDNDPGAGNGMALIITNTWENIFDITPPESEVLPLSMAPTDTIFELSWTGRDDLAGVRHFTLFVRKQGGEYGTVLVNTEDTIQTFIGEPGTVYEFVSIATDRAGNIEEIAGTPDVIVDLTTAIPASLIDKYQLGRVYPQPAKGSLRVPFSLGKSENVEITIMDIMGRPVVKPLTNRNFIAGKYEVTLDVRALPAGMYTLQLTAGEFQKGTVIVLN